jgi:hypothetical protein
VRPTREPGVGMASLPERRLRDAHTAATVLFLLQIPDRTVMVIIAAIRRDVATSIGGLPWKASLAHVSVHPQRPRSLWLSGTAVPGVIFDSSINRCGYGDRLGEELMCEVRSC